MHPSPVLLLAVVVAVRSLSVERPFLPTVVPPETTARPAVTKAAPASSNRIAAAGKKSTFLPTVAPDIVVPSLSPPPIPPAVPPTTSPASSTATSGQQPFLEATIAVLTGSSTSPPHSTPLPEERPQDSTLRDDIASSGNASVSTLDEILEVWDPHSVRRRWSGWLRAINDPTLGGAGASPDDPSWRRCSADLVVYLENLQRGSAWAVMLSDASGRAPRGVFDGNAYWLGSRALCDDLTPGRAPPPVQLVNPFRRRDVDPTFPPAGITPSAPFALQFFVAKLAVNVSTDGLRLTQTTSLGLCLPASCSTLDVTRLVRAAIAHPEGVRLRAIRPLGHYDFWTDPVFHVLVVVAAIALLLMVVGTGVDLAWRGEDVRKTPPPHARRCDIIRNPAAPVTPAEDHDDALDDQGRRCAGCPQWLLFGLQCFSVRVNLGKLLALKVGEDALTTVHGLRVLSLLWVILAHVSLIIFHLADNKDFRARAERDFLYQVLSSGTFSVDTFFFLSGLLLAYLFFQSCNGKDLLPGGLAGFKGRLIQFAGMLLYRFIRLVPPYMFVLGVVQLSMKHFHANGVAELPARDYETCPKYWWRNLLFINTFFPNNQRCMTWSWYLADDTQFYALGAILLIVAVSYFWVAVGAMSVLLLSSWLTTAVVAYSSHHLTSFKEPFAHYDELYDKPWTRFGPHLVGMVTGWLLSRTRCKLHLHPVAVVAGWAVAAVTLVGCVFGLYGTRLSPAASAAYVALSHTAWALAVAWVLVACLTGHGGWVARVLQWPALFPASRLSYCAYLLHPQIIRNVSLHTDSSFHMAREHVAILFAGFCVATFFLAALLSLLLEAPVVSLLSAVRKTRALPGTPATARRTTAHRPVVPPMPASWKTAGFGY